MPDFAWIQPEEVIFQTLAAAKADVLAAVGAGTIATYVATIFGSLTAAQHADLVTWFSTKDIKLVHGWPVFEHQEFPCIAIILGPEADAQQYIGRSAGDRVLTTGETVRTEAVRRRSEFGIVAHAENADLTRWLYDWLTFRLADQDVTLSLAFPYLRQVTVGKPIEPTMIGDTGRFVFGRAIQYVVEYDQVHVKTFTPITIPDMGLDANGIEATVAVGIGN